MSISELGDHPLQFVCWAPNVPGGSVTSNIPQRISWDIDYDHKLAQIAECASFDYALMQIRFTAGYGVDDQHELVFFSQALFASTNSLKMIAALFPGPWNLILVAKQIAAISHLYGPRIAVNIVNGWFRGEFKAIGEPWLDHEEHCLRSEEFAHCLQGVWREDSFTLAGDFYRLCDCSLRPKPLVSLPEIFQGGSPCAAWDMTVHVPDWCFTNDNVPEGIKTQVDDIRCKAAQSQHQVKTGVNGFVIARESEKEAQVVLREIIDNANSDAVEGSQYEVKSAGSASPGSEGSWARSSFKDLVQYNDDFETNLIGTPQQITERTIALKQLGVNLLLLAFLHFREEVELFKREVILRVRKLEKQSQPTTAHIVPEILKY